MIAYIALIFTILFILIVLKRDSKRGLTVSSAIWIPLIWMIYSAAKPISLWFRGMSNGPLEEKFFHEGSSIDRYILSMLMIFSLYVLKKRNIDWGLIFKTNAFFTFWLLYCGISVLWADFPFISFKRWIKEIGLFLSVLIVLTEIEPIEAVKLIIKRFSYILIPLSLLIMIYSPELGISGSTYQGMINYSGVSWNKNGFGRICLVSGFFFFYNLASMRRMNKKGNYKENYFIQALFFVIIFYLLCILDSATSLGAFIIGIFIFIMLGTSFMKNNSRYLGVFIVIAFITGIILQISFEIIGILVKSSGRDLTFTNRTYIWNDLLAFHTNPLIGVGYGSFWLGERLTILWEKYGIHLNESHNGYLNVYLELGQIGLLLLSGVIYFAYRNIRKALSYNYDYGRFRMVLLVIALLYNITEDAFGRFTLIWFVFLLATINIPQKLQLHYTEKVSILASAVSQK